MRCKSRFEAVATTIGTYALWGVMIMWAVSVYELQHLHQHARLVAFVLVTWEFRKFPGADLSKSLPKDKRVGLANAEQVRKARHLMHAPAIGCSYLFVVTVVDWLLALAIWPALASLIPA